MGFVYNPAMSFHFPPQGHPLGELFWQVVELEGHVRFAKNNSHSYSQEYITERENDLAEGKLMYKQKKATLPQTTEPMLWDERMMR